MFLGHFAVGFAAKRAAPGLPLAFLFAAAQFADILWPFLLALGVEQVRIDPGNTAFTPLAFTFYPWSHSLVLLAVYGVGLGVAAASRRGIEERGLRRGASIGLIAAVVVSHWLLDWLTHAPDMPVYPGGPRVGLGLWNSVPLTLVVELTAFAVALWFYVGGTRPRDRAGKWGLVVLVGFLLAAYGGAIGTPPPSVTAIYLVSIAGVVVVLAMAWWVDRHRVPVSGA